MSQPAGRSAADRCPGVFSTHPAADGHLARIRLPGGEITGPQLETLARVATEWGDGHLELTARANLQLRGITDVEAVAAAVTGAGLVPSASHEKIRNIEASPLSGRIGGVVDVRPMIRLLDERLRADDRFAALSGRFLFGLDDGRGDITRRSPDVHAVARASTDHRSARPGPLADIVVGGATLGSATGAESIVDALLVVADAMLEVAPTAWRFADLDAADQARVVERAGKGLDPVGDGYPRPETETEPIVGWFEQDNGMVLLGSVVELGRLPARLAEFLAAIGAPIIFTPDREILVCDLTEGVAETVVRVLAPMGLTFDASSPWAAVSCCAGAPGCSNGLAPVREDLLARVASGQEVTEREHWVGCGRGCGSPVTPHLRVEAGPDGYRTTERGQ
ncbi:precorrin-3B synthase [Gordonia sp. NPDC003585]|uniref:precorrin-3B synthase n=1 Tax=unclassified Gordonia (in: high G+C Gram-positive bacteria) TaxID=2657482 RepID=UPI0033A26DEA